MNKQEALYLPVIKEGLIFSTDSDECKRYYRTLDGEEVSSSFKAKSKEELLNQLKPVVPKFVAEWLKKYRHAHTLLRVLNAAEKEQIVPSAVNDWILDNQYDFIKAWIDGWDIAKEVEADEYE